MLEVIKEVTEEKGQEEEIDDVDLTQIAQEITEESPELTLLMTQPKGLEYGYCIFEQLSNTSTEFDVLHKANTDVNEMC